MSTEYPLPSIFPVNMSYLDCEWSGRNISQLIQIELGNDAVARDPNKLAYFRSAPAHGSDDTAAIFHLSLQHGVTLSFSNGRATQVKYTHITKFDVPN